ncbi:hypothetical protein K0817_008195 [Microbacterium sp. HD4P20]|uniref:hypothetical protein n=1 Tax=Microbacterium sp. HD4P20 TaxID=2864874 RepID=UPI001C644A86|nr:hypothetical protein [Microbacterium sp. HD4P20]MCP2636549.1 hypothetical protein [Microbacterium sp. HD4P20]
MGLFVQRPEFNDELPGLPGEPLRVETAAERPVDAAPVDAASLDLLGLGGSGTVESIVFPVAPVIEIAQPRESGEDE